MMIRTNKHRVNSGFYCLEAVEAYEEFEARFVISARKTSRLVEHLRRAAWQPSLQTDGDAECEFRYQPDGSQEEYRFVALRYEKHPWGRRPSSTSCSKPASTKIGSS